MNYTLFSDTSIEKENASSLPCEAVWLTILSAGHLNDHYVLSGLFSGPHIEAFFFARRLKNKNLGLF